MTLTELHCWSQYFKSRIESWWGVLNKEGIEYWIQVLGEMKDKGLFVGDWTNLLCFEFLEHYSGEVKETLLFKLQLHVNYHIHYYHKMLLGSFL